MKRYLIEVHNGRRTVARGEVGLYDPKDATEVNHAADLVMRTKGEKRAEPGWRIQVWSLGRRTQKVAEQIRG